MEPIQSAAPQTSAEIGQRVNAGQALANAVSIQLKLPRIGSTEPQLSMQDISELIMISSFTKERWFEEAWRRTQGEKDRDKFIPDLSSVVLASEVGQNKAVEALSRIVKLYFARLLVPSGVRDDWGACVFNDFVTNPLISGFTVKGALLPACGYPRTVLAPALQFFKTAEFAFSPPSIDSPEVRALASAQMRTDLHRFVFRMFAPPDKFGNGIERRDRMWGDASALTYILERLWVFSALYRLSAQATLYSFYKSLRDKCKEHYLRRVHVAHDAVALDEEAESFYASIPVHPSGTYFANCLASVEMDTLHGHHRPVLYEKATDLQKWLRGDGTQPTECGDGSEVFAILYERHLSRLAATHVTASACAIRGWDSLTSAAPGDLTSSLMAAALRGVRIGFGEKQSSMLDEIRAMASLLGWSTIPGSIGTIDALGANFAYTDGLRCSKGVDCVALGFTPCISLANVKAKSLDPHLEVTFLTRRPEGVSLVPINGLVDLTTAGAQIERASIPLGMAIQEPGLEEINAYSISGISTLAVQIKKHYDSKMNLYPRRYYGQITPVVTGDDQVVFDSDWDTFGLTDLPEGALGVLKEQWSAALTAAGAGEKAADALYAVRIGGAEFYTREVVLPVLEPEYDVFSSIGRYVETLPYHGFVMFQNRFEFAADFAELDKLLAVSPARGSTAVHTANTSADVAKLVGADAEALKK